MNRLISFGDSHDTFPIYIFQATKDKKIGILNGGVADLSFPGSKTRRGRVIENGTISPTITTSPNIYKISLVNND